MIDHSKATSEMTVFNLKTQGDLSKHNAPMTLNLDAYLPEEEANEFLYLISRQLWGFKKKGILALDKIDVDNARLIMTAAWHAGWSVAVFPENMPDDNKQIMLDKLDLDIIISDQDAPYDSVNNTQFIHLKIGHYDDSKDNPKDFLSWLERNSLSIDEACKTSHIWQKDETALYLFTSGTTGFPKGVLFSLQSLVNSTQNFVEHFSIADDDSILNTASLHTIAGIRYSIILPLIHPCDVHVPKEVIDLRNIISVLETYQPSILITGPVFIQLLSCMGDKMSNIPLRLRFILSGGSKLDHQYRSLVWEKLNIPVLNIYGLTETVGTVLADPFYEDAHSALQGSKAFMGATLKIIDQDNVERDDGEGELRVYSDNLYLGYLGEVMRCPAFFDTNDQVRIEDTGHVIWLHRLDNCIKGGSGDWIHSEAVNTWVTKQDSVVDVHSKLSADTLNRPQFQVEVAGIKEADWADWCSKTYLLLVNDLGKDYQCIQWVRVDEIIRSSQGKYEYARLMKGE